MKPVDPKLPVLWGRRIGAPVWAEDVLCTQPERFDEVRRLAAADGFTGFRVAELGGVPDFAGTVRNLASQNREVR